MSDYRREETLEYHSRRPAGKIEVRPTKPCDTQWDLSLAYTPGVAVPCKEIERDPTLAARYTARQNLVAVITNGTAVLGLGDIGPLASKPVMEGKGVLFKRFAGIDVFDLELDCKDPEELIRIVQALEPTFGGINLEDIKAPECFHIERTLRESMNIPVFHDDQHGTAIISTAAFINAVEIAGKKPEDCRVVFSGAGAAGVACGDLIAEFGVLRQNIVYCDSKGPIYLGREGLNESKQRLAVQTDARSLADAMVGTDAFFGVSVGGVVSQDMVRSMADNPIVFAMANPDPEITFPDAKAARPDVIVATGRSDFPNQVNNVLGFPYIFRGALDCGATTVNQQMKMAAARALADLAREDVPDEVREAYGGAEIRFGTDYLIPKPVDHRVLLYVAPAVAQSATESGVARQPMLDLEAYRQELAQFLSRTRQTMGRIITRARTATKRIVFPEGLQPKVLRACRTLADRNIVHPVVLGPEAAVRAVADQAGVSLDGVEVIDNMSAAEDERRGRFVDQLFRMRQRKGVTREIAVKDIDRKRFFGMMMLRNGDADGLVSGIGMHYPATIRPALQILGLKEGSQVCAGMYMMLLEGRTLFFADTTVNIEPSAEELAEIALLCAHEVARLGMTPRVAMLSFSNFGSNNDPRAGKVRRATELVRAQRPSLTVDGEMQVDPAINPAVAKGAFPFSQIQGDANILVFPGLEAANVAYKLLMGVGGAEAIGPILLGMRYPVNVLQRGSSSEEVVNMAAYTAVQAQLQGRLV